MRRRTLGRELALKFLYTLEVEKALDVTGFDAFARHQERNAEVRDFARTLVDGVTQSRERLRAAIEKRSTNWTWKQMPVIDRVVLLLGAHEILDRDDIPAAVTVDEIVNLAKKFSTKSSGAFVNGVLDGLAKSAGERRE